jgi:hypothetical protein
MVDLQLNPPRFRAKAYDLSPVQLSGSRPCGFDPWWRPDDFRVFEN